MSEAVRRSFAVTFPRPEDPAAVACLDSLDELAKTLEGLAALGLCTYQVTTAAAASDDLVNYEVMRNFFASRGHGGPTRVTCNVMDALAELHSRRSDIRVRFYCREYGHQMGVCDCPWLMLGREWARHAYKRLGSLPIARRWAIDRTDLLALTDDQLAAIPAHPNTREHIITFATWLRGQPAAE